MSNKTIATISNVISDIIIFQVLIKKAICIKALDMTQSSILML